MIRRTPLFWLQLTHQKSRLVVTIVGVASAVILMFMQLGFRDGMFESSVSIHKNLQADLVLLHSKTEYFEGMKPFPRRILYNVLAIEGVASVSPFYYSEGEFKNPNTFVTKPIAVYAFRPDRSVFKLPEVDRQLDVLTQADTVLFDRLSRSEYGSIASQVEKEGTTTTELSNKKIRVGGLFSLGGGVLASDGILIMSDLNYSHILNEPLEKVQMGLLQLEPGIDRESIVKNISSILPKDIKVLTLENFMKIEKQYWVKSTPIGFIFNAGTILGCVFGGIIVYQILYTQISDNLHIYATFKAIGYGNSYLVGIVLQQALLMSVMGFIPGIDLCLYLYDLIQDAARLPMMMTFSRASIVLLLTIAMCSLAGILAMSKVRSADPADLFR
jgi:putative ABC transport system permease protein